MFEGRKQETEKLVTVNNFEMALPSPFRKGMLGLYRQGAVE